MKWVFLTVLVLVTGAVAAFGIYTWGWREIGDEAATERARAEFTARRIALRVCEGCESEGLEPRAGSVWTVTLDGRCLVFDTDRIRIDPEGNFVDGVAPC